MKKFWNWTREPDSGTAVMRIDGPIADDVIWGDETTARAFRKDLDRHPGDVVIYINSPGGSVTAASEIYSMLKERRGRSTARIESLAASAASVVAMGCTRVEMARTAYMMIHNSATVALGDHREMDHAAEMLREIDRGIMSAYTERTGLGEDEIRAMMEAETWMSAETAIGKGFADGFIGETPYDPEEEDPEEGYEDPEADPDGDSQEDPEEEKTQRARARLRALL